MKRVCVYCGSRSGRDPRYAGAARKLGQVLAERNIGIVYGAGNVGLMGVLAGAALAAGGSVIGVIPEALQARELLQVGLTEAHVVTDMHARKAAMAARADAFVALPGGIGTLEELCEILTWKQLAIIGAPVGLLNTAGFYDPFLAFLDHLVETDFSPSVWQHLVVGEEPEDLLERMGFPSA